MVSLSGWGERAGVPAWDGEMKGLFNQYYYDELLEVAPDGHVPHDWPWNSGSFRDLRYDDLVADPDFLQKFEEVTGGMLRGSRSGWFAIFQSGSRSGATRRTCTRGCFTGQGSPGPRVDALLSFWSPGHWAPVGHSEYPASGLDAVVLPSTGVRPAMVLGLVHAGAVGLAALCGPDGLGGRTRARGFWSSFPLLQPSCC